MAEENKNNGGTREETRMELERKGARKVRDLAKKTEEKAEKELKNRKNQ